MKKVKLLLALFASTALLAGCGGESQSFGFGGVATYSNTPGNYDSWTAQTEVNYASVLVSSKGVINKLRIDTVQLNAKAADGLVVIDSKEVGTTGDVQSKWEQLGDYNMKPASPISKEWYEQALNFETWAVGKTLVQIKAGITEIELTEGVAAGVTIHVDGFVKALEEAFANKVSVKGTVSQIGVGGLNTLNKTYGENPVVVGHDYTIGGAAFDKDKKVISARIDTFQVPYKFVEEQVKVDETKNQIVAADKRVRGKQELKEEYNMKPASPIDKEWYEQAASLAGLLVGKTVSAALGTAAELADGATAGVTMKIAGYRSALLEAEHTAFNSRLVA